MAVGTGSVPVHITNHDLDGASSVVVGTCEISPVYTPTSHRGNPGFLAPPGMTASAFHMPFWRRFLNAKEGIVNIFAAAWCAPVHHASSNPLLSNEPPAPVVLPALIPECPPRVGASHTRTRGVSLSCSNQTQGSQPRNVPERTVACTLLAPPIREPAFSPSTDFQSETPTRAHFQ